MARGVPALNVAVSVGVVLFEAVRQGRAAKMSHPPGSEARHEGP
jgi:tRNA(Leu) C34 or U34 (ribose-2'-O)-methylase TrmL